MNCFNNNVPKLTSAEHLRNKRSKTLYGSKVIDYKRGISKGNIDFYRNGKIRTTSTYQNKRDITLGYSLCTDGRYTGCNKNDIQTGIFRCKNSKLLDLQNVKVGTGRDSIYNKFSGAVIDSVFTANPLTGFLVLQSWFNGFCHDISNGKPPYLNEFANKNVYSDDINININELSQDVKNFRLGNNIVIDPANKLFGTNYCFNNMTNNSMGVNKYLQYSSQSVYSVVTGNIMNPSGGASAFSCDSYVTSKDSSDNEIRLPRKGDIAISGVASILDFNGNVSCIEELALNINNIPTSLSKKYKEYLLSYLITQTWAFQWLSGIGIVDRVCCIGKDSKGNDLFQVYIKSVWGNIMPPDKLPAEEGVVLNKDNIEIKEWRTGKNKVYLGGKWDTPNDYSEYIKNLISDTSGNTILALIGKMHNNYLSGSDFKKLGKLMECISDKTFAGKNPGGHKSGTLDYGGGIAFVSQKQLSKVLRITLNDISKNSYKAFGTGIAPLSLMGWKNTSHYEWGNIYMSESLSGKAAKDSSDNGLNILQHLERVPYTVKLETGYPCVKNTSSGNNTQQNYMVSYDNNAGNVTLNVGETTTDVLNEQQKDIKPDPEPEPGPPGPPGPP